MKRLLINKKIEQNLKIETSEKRPFFAFTLIIFSIATEIIFEIFLVGNFEKTRNYVFYLFWAKIWIAFSLLNNEIKDLSDLFKAVMYPFLIFWQTTWVIKITIFFLVTTTVFYSLAMVSQDIGEMWISMNYIASYCSIICVYLLTSLFHHSTLTLKSSSIFNPIVILIFPIFEPVIYLSKAMIYFSNKLNHIFKI